MGSVPCIDVWCGHHVTSTTPLRTVETHPHESSKESIWLGSPAVTPVFVMTCTPVSGV